MQLENTTAYIGDIVRTTQHTCARIVEMHAFPLLGVHHDLSRKLPNLRTIMVAGCDARFVKHRVNLDRNRL